MNSIKVNMYDTPVGGWRAAVVSALFTTNLILDIVNEGRWLDATGLLVMWILLWAASKAYVALINEQAVMIALLTAHNDLISKEKKDGTFSDESGLNNDEG